MVLFIGCEAVWGMQFDAVDMSEMSAICQNMSINVNRFKISPTKCRKRLETTLAVLAQEMFHSWQYSLMQTCKPYFYTLKF